MPKKLNIQKSGSNKIKKLNRQISNASRQEKYRLSMKENLMKVAAEDLSGLKSIEPRNNSVQSPIVDKQLDLLEAINENAFHRSSADDRRR